MLRRMRTTIRFDEQLLKTLGNDHATSSTFSTNSSGASTPMPFGFGLVAAKLACPGNLRFATGDGAAPAIALRCFWVQRLDRPRRLSPKGENV